MIVLTFASLIKHSHILNGVLCVQCVTHVAVCETTQRSHHVVIAVTRDVCLMFADDVFVSLAEDLFTESVPSIVLSHIVLISIHKLLLCECVQID